MSQVANELKECLVSENSRRNMNMDSQRVLLKWAWALTLGCFPGQDSLYVLQSNTVHDHVIICNRISFLMIWLFVKCVLTLLDLNLSSMSLIITDCTNRSAMAWMLLMIMLLDIEVWPQTKREPIKFSLLWRRFSEKLLNMSLATWISLGKI